MDIIYDLDVVIIVNNVVMNDIKINVENVFIDNVVVIENHKVEDNVEVVEGFVKVINFKLENLKVLIKVNMIVIFESIENHFAMVVKVIESNKVINLNEPLMGIN